MRHIYVGMSGGVDSSVTAALCKQQGYEVTGVYMKNWTQDVGGAVCPWRKDLADAQSVAAHLDIPFKVFDFETEYKQLVVDYMLDEYRAGRTPNPDIMCNQEVKFKLFLDAALKEGAGMIATGHYARIMDADLYTGVDTDKDQSYFLYRVSRDALSRSTFPLGDLTKSIVRQKAQEFNLPTASKPDSQGICFIGEVSIKEFLAAYIDTEPGPIKHVNGEVLGEHDGAVFYTIGQRKGLGIGGTLRSAGGGGLPLYVVDKDMKANTVYVSEQLDMLRESSFTIADTHWINEFPAPDKRYLVRTRHRGDLRPAMITVHGDDIADIALEEPERALAPGQSAVAYEETSEGLRVLGGGVIKHKSST